MSGSNDQKPDRQEIEELLAWHAAGTLEPDEARRVEAALARDPELARSYRQAREELAGVVEANEALGAPSPRALDALFEKIDREPASARAIRAGLIARLASFWASLSPTALGWAAAAATLVIAVQAAVIGSAVMRPGRPAAAYGTASAPAPAAAAPGAYALVRFSPKATSGEITALLQASGAVIADGPTEGGLYRVRLAPGPVTPERRAALAARLQAAKGVEFAAPAQ